jgi:hypothetical protein
MTKAEAEEKEKLLRESIVDEYGALVEELAPFKGKQSRVEELAKVIRSWFADADAELGAVATGTKYEAVLGAKQLTTLIGINAAFALLGKAKFLQAASLTMKALEAHLQPSALSSIISKARTGSRTLLVNPLVNPRPEK